MRKLTRRELLKVSLGTMGAMALANLPNWNKPALRVGVLPAHAQTSQPRPDMQAVLTWNKGLTEPPERGGKASIVDCNLFVMEPDGTMVYYSQMNGPTSFLDVDNWWGFGPETNTVPEGKAAAGTYYISLNFYVDDPDDFPLTMTLEVTSFKGKPAQQNMTFIRAISIAEIGKSEYQLWPIAKVEFPSGNISAWNPPVKPQLPGGAKKH